MKKRSVFLLILCFIISGCVANGEVLTPALSQPTSFVAPAFVTPVATISETPTAPLIPGDLGWGKIHGKIVDASTGAPIIGAIVTCEHHSYTASATCSGTVIVDENGKYVFENVFFHDTDTIKITVQATGYQTQEVVQSSFTINDREVNISLSPTP